MQLALPTTENTQPRITSARRPTIPKKLGPVIASHDIDVISQHSINTTENASHVLPPQDVMEGYRAWPEKIMTSQTGCHLGHHKAWLLSPDTSTLPPHLQRSPTLSNEDFFEIIRLKLSLCISLHHPLQRWS